MFVLATSNLLVSPQALQTLLQVVYDCILLLVGARAMELKTVGQIDALRKKIRGLPLIDHLMDLEAMVPNLMLPGPQVLGLPAKDKAVLHSALGRVAEAAGSGYAALVSEGLYLAATPEWWLLSPREALLLQHITTHVEPEASLVDMPVYLSVRAAATPMRLLALMMDPGVQLLVLVGEGVDGGELKADLERHMKRAEAVFKMPLWCTPPVPQFTGVSFDMAAVISHAASSTVTLFWGRASSAAPPGLNPLMSPTLRRQLGSTGSPTASGALRSISLPSPGPHPGGADSLQLYFSACADLVVAFMLRARCRQAGQRDRAAQAAAAQANLRSSAAATSTAAGGDDSDLASSEAVLEGCVAAAQLQRPPQLPPAPSTPSAAQRIFSSFISLAGSITGNMAPRPTLDEEVHLAGGSGTRLVGLLDRSSTATGCSVFLVTSAARNRQEAADAARKLRSVFQMSYTAEAE